MDATNEVPRLLRIAEVAAVLGVSRSKAYQLAQAGDIPTIRMGASVRVPSAALAAWVESRTQKPAA